MARVLFAPNPELCALLERTTGRPCRLMPRGVDAELFHPAKRRRKSEDDGAVLGFVGRLSVEKNVTLLAQIQQELEQMGQSNFRFLIVGHGNEEAWLRERLPRAEFTGVLKGEALAEAYARMDLFVFPSHTDTFGNVVLEALASGVPAIVTPDGGPATIVRNGETGRVVPDEEFAAAIAGVLAGPERHAQMRLAARSYALTMSWDSVFEDVYAAYETMLPKREQS
jgi:glycosyltransferase involved in cell wall biosynthesis